MAKLKNGISHDDFGFEERRFSAEKCFVQKRPSTLARVFWVFFFQLIMSDGDVGMTRFGRGWGRRLAHILIDINSAGRGGGRGRVALGGIFHSSQINVSFVAFLTYCVFV